MQYILGIWLVDSQTNKIRNSETRESVRLSPRDMQVLHYFLQNHNKVISLEELVEVIWQGRVVGDHAIYRVINKIRKHLDPSDKDAYIETIPKMGYKLTQAVELYAEQESLKKNNSQDYDSPDVNSNLESALKSAEKPVRQKPKYQLLKIGILLALLMAFGVLVWQKVIAPQRYLGAQKLYSSFEPFLTLPGYQDYPSSSNNGKYVVFSYKEKVQDAFNLYVKNTETGDIVKITDTPENDINARISDNAENIIFVSQSANDCKVVRYKLFENQYLEENLFNCIGNNNLDLEINAEGDKLFYTHRNNDNLTNRIYSMIANTGERVQITNYLSNQAIGDIEIAYSEFQNKLFFIRKPSVRKSAIYEVDLRTNSEKEIISIEGEIRDLKYREQFETLTYKKNATSVTEYSLKYNIEKELLSSLSEKIYAYDFISPLNKILIVSGSEENSLWQKNINAGFGLEQLTLSEYRDSLPRFANKSSLIAFLSDRSGSQQVWLKSGDDIEYQLSRLNNRGYINWLSWSPNDRYLLSTDADRVFIIDVDSGDVSDLQIGPEYVELRMPTWSSDGKAIYFSAFKGSEIQIFKYDISQQNIQQITNTGVIALFDRGENGQFFIKAHRKGLWKILNNSEKLVIPDIASSSYLQSIEFTDKGIYFIKDASKQIYYLAYAAIQSGENAEKTNVRIENKRFSLNSAMDKVIYSLSSKQNTNILISKSE